MRIVSSALVALALVSAPAFASDQVFVEKATGTGATPSDLDAATELVKSAIPEVTSDTVVERPEMADFTLRPKLIRLGETYVMSLSKVKYDKEVFTTQLKAGKLDELDKVAARLTRSVILGEHAASSPRVGEITDPEAREGTERRATRKAAYLGFGGAGLSNLAASGIGYSLGGAFAWDVNVAMLKLMAEIEANGSAVFTSAGIGGNYFLSTSDFAPYVSADFGAGLAKIDGGGALEGQSVGGFVLGAGAGIMLLRTSSTNLDVGFHAGFLLHENALGAPQSYTLRLGLYF